jgi:hypothetical protein
MLERLVGHWELSGTMMGRDLKQGCAASWALDGQFVNLSCRETREPPLAKVAYESVMFIGYDPVSERFVAHLMDVYGPRYSTTLGLGALEQQVIRLVFEYPESPLHTIMEWQSGAGSWKFTLLQKDKNGEWTNFAEKQLRRKTPGPPRYP